MTVKKSNQQCFNTIEPEQNLVERQENLPAWPVDPDITLYLLNKIEKMNCRMDSLEQKGSSRARKMNARIRKLEKANVGKTVHQWGGNR